ncbi:hypothetical protein [Xylophilus ampelinus]|uniref:hypothetical protein n=1 Tax=Xylophilus ampelinus TaxID=54067 RepID=UPI0011B619A1|nr:hypothetical protein [Xylophilus ampelinus]MCS4511504.1 hypothetical protein [Xylophilus ampelinus]
MARLVLGAARAAAAERLVQAEAVFAQQLDGVVVFSRLWRRRGRTAVRVRMCWPGVVEEVIESTGELLRVTPVYSLRNRAGLASFMAKAAGVAPLMSVSYTPPNPDATASLSMQRPFCECSMRVRVMCWPSRSLVSLRCCGQVSTL